MDLEQIICKEHQSCSVLTGGLQKCINLLRITKNEFRLLLSVVENVFTGIHAETVNASREAQELEKAEESSDLEFKTKWATRKLKDCLFVEEKFVSFCDIVFSEMRFKTERRIRTAIEELHESLIDFIKLSHELSQRDRILQDSDIKEFLKFEIAQVAINAELSRMKGFEHVFDSLRKGDEYHLKHVKSIFSSRIVKKRYVNLRSFLQSLGASLAENIRQQKEIGQSLARQRKSVRMRSCVCF